MTAPPPPAPVYVVTTTGDHRHIAGTVTGRTMCARIIGATITDTSPRIWATWPVCARCQTRQAQAVGRALGRATVGAVRIPPPKGAA